MALNSGKLGNLILFIANHKHVKDLGITKLWKLIYFIDAAALREFGESITSSEFIKYEHGPVPSRGEKVLKKLRKNDLVSTEAQPHHTYVLTNIKPCVEPDISVFSGVELEIMSEICTRYGSKTAQQLSELSHQEPSWRVAKYLQKLDEHLMYYSSREDSIGL